MGTTARWSLWTFHDITDSGYDWTGRLSDDRGRTWHEGWIINVRPKE